MSEKRQITASQVAIAWEKWEDGIRPISLSQLSEPSIFFDIVSIGEGLRYLMVSRGCK